MDSILVATGLSPRSDRALRRVSETIFSAGGKARADLLVVGTHSRTGIEKFFLGSMAEKVLRRAEIDVLVFPSSTRTADLKPTQSLVAG